MGKRNKLKMTKTIPSSALELGISIEEYSEIARNVGRVKLIPLEQRRKILERADEELPEEISSKLHRLVKDMAYDREVYHLAGIPYHNGPPEGQKLFITAVTDFLLRQHSFRSIK